MAKNLLKFYKNSQQPTNVAAGSIWFNTTNRTIEVYNGTEWEKFAGKLESADWKQDEQKLTIKKYDGSSIELDFSNIASLEALAAINEKLGEGFTKDYTVEDAVAAINEKLGEGFDTDNTVAKAIADVLGESTDTYDKNTVYGAKAYADHVLGEAINGDGGLDKRLQDVEGYIETFNADLEETDATTLRDLNEKIDNVSGAAKSYTIKKLSDAEVAALGENVKEAYQLEQTVGTTTSQAGETIKIYKDSSLESVELVAEDDKGVAGQFLKYVYVKADGTKETVYVNVSEFLVEAEFKHGFDVKDSGEVYLKIKEGESRLSVNADGLAFNSSSIVSASGETDDAALISASANEANEVTVGSTQKLKDAVSAAESALQSAEGDNTYVTATAADNKVSVAALVKKLDSIVEGQTDTGLADARDVKEYIDSIASDKIASVTGDDYVVATTDDDKNVTLATKVSALAADAEGLAKAADVYDALCWVEFE